MVLRKAPTGTTIASAKAERPRGVLARIKRREDVLRRGEGDSPRAWRRAYWRCYNRVFLLMALIVLAFFLVNGRSIVWRIDGLQQYYPFFVYEGEWLRGIVRSVLAGHPEVPMWNWSLGYGSDVIVTLDVIFDPVNLFSIFAPQRYAEYLYQALLFLRLWMAGAAFSAYALRRGNGRFPALCGAVAYAFSVSLLEGLIWPGSMAGAILFPLVLLGVEKLLDGGRPYVLLASAAQLFISSYYYAYIIAILLVAYCAVRVVQTEKSLTPLVFLRWVLRIAAPIALAGLIACFSLVPALTALLGVDRFTTATVETGLLYSWSYYVGIVPGFLSSYIAGSDCYVGYGAVAFLSCMLLFRSGREERALRIAFVVTSVMLLVPFAGRVFNGFNYPTNRWVFAYAMLVTYAVCRMVPRLAHLDRGDVRVLLGSSLFMVAWVFLLPAARTEVNVAALLVLFSVLVPLLAGGISERTKRVCLLGGIVAAFSVSAFYFVDAGEGGIASSCPSVGAVWQNSTSDSPIAAVATATSSDDSFWRYDVDPSDISPYNKTYSILRNNNLLFGMSGYNFYNSIYNSSIDRFHTELGLANTDVNFSYNSLGGRSYLEALGSTKYYLVPADGAETGAYGFVDESNLVYQGTVNKGSYKVYRATDPLPFGFTFSSVVTRSTYESLSMAGRQESLLQGVVLSDEDAASTNLPETSLSNENESVPYTVTATSGCTVEDGQIKVTSSGAKVTLTFSGLAASETYLQFVGLDYTWLSPLARTSSSFSSLRWYQKAKVLQQELTTVSPSSWTIYATSNLGSANRYIGSYVSNYHMYGGKTDWLLDLGYSTEAQSSVTLSFDKVGLYTFSDLSIVCQPMDSYYSRVDALKQETLQNVEMGTNTLSGTISLDSEKVLFLSVPWSAGWSATVDGEPATLLKADTAFMALDLSAGEHTVELTYCTPGLAKGALMSAFGVAVLVACLVWEHVRRGNGKLGKAA